MTVKGKWTPCDLSRPEVLPFFQNNHQFTAEAAMLSLELAASSYDMETENWMEAGWTDFSFQADSKLYTGSSVNPSSTFRLQHTWSKLMNTLARHRIIRDNPISQLRGAIRQKQTGDSCKAFTMLYPLDENSYVVAIGFMGTGKRVFDWMPNFRLQRKGGLHLGFLELSQVFEKACDRILFPNTAHFLKEDKLTLTDILKECTQSNSRFKIWMAGHSQGGAVMQIFTDHILQMGVLPENIFGCGFASPSVADGPLSFPVRQYPLVHLVNSDDMVPKVGAFNHFGSCLVFNVKDSVRRICYAKDFNNPCFQTLLSYAHTTTDGRSAFLFILGLLQALLTIDDDQAVKVVAGAIGLSLPDTFSSAIGNKVDFLSWHLYRKAKKAYLKITGDSAIPLAPVRWHASRITRIIAHYGPSVFARTLSQALSLPHHLRSHPQEAPSVYQYIILEAFSQLRPLEEFTPNGLAVSNNVYVIPKKPAISRFRPLTVLKKRRQNAFRY